MVYDDKKNAIIIENKISNAVDQYNQLGRYYEAAKNMGMDVKTIVYLTLTQNMQPNKEIAIKSHREKIEKLLIPVSIIHTNKELSFSDGFIGECAKHEVDNELARVYYTEYNELIKSLGGKSMAMEYYMPAIEEIYSDEEKLKKFKEFGDLWNNKDAVIAQIIMSHLEKNGFKEHPDDPETVFLKINDNISLGFHTAFSFGFVYTPGAEFSGETQSYLASYLESGKLKNIYSKSTPGVNGAWVWKDVDIDRIKDLKDILKDIIDNYNILKEKVQKRG